MKRVRDAVRNVYGNAYATQYVHGLTGDRVNKPLPSFQRLRNRVLVVGEDRTLISIRRPMVFGYVLATLATDQLRKEGRI